MSSFQNDQAAGLRRIMAAPKPIIVSIMSASSAENQPRLLSNLAASINEHGSNVLVVHAAQESREASKTYEVDALPTLMDVAHRKAALSQSIKNSALGFSVTKLLPKNQILTPLDSRTDAQLNEVFNKLANQYEIVLVDATLNKNHLLPLSTLNESEILIQLTRHPESIKQGYLLIKQICNQLGRRPFGVIVDGANDAQAAIVFRNISQVARRFMQIELEFFGAIPTDEHLSRATKLGRAVIDAFPLSTASTAFKSLAQRLDYRHQYDVEIEQASFII